jgi:large subunit ribosomal protein L10
MARPEKVAEVQAITEKIQAAKSIVLADYAGLTVEQMTIFRAQCREQQVQCRVVKNRLAKIACDNAELSELKDHLTGPIAMIFGPESQVDPAKITVNFAKDNEAMEIKAGFLDGQILDTAAVVALSMVPSKDELIAKMMGSINSPLTGLAMTFNGVISGLARVIDAVAKQKAEAADPA